MASSNPKNGCQSCKFNLAHVSVPEDIRLAIDINLKLLSISKKQATAKTALLDLLVRKVSSLRNSSGGALLIHLVDRNSEDHNLHYFHQFVDEPLNNLLQQQQSFADTYQFKDLKDYPITSGSYEQPHQFLILIVRGSGLLSVANFHTEHRTDFQRVPLSSCVLYQYLSNTTESQEDPIERGYKYLSGEDRSIEFKEYIHKDRTICEFVNYLWTNLKLPHYITAFAKLPEGGSYFLGIREKKEKYEQYASQKLELCGVLFKKKEIQQIKTQIDTQIKKSIHRQPKGDLKNIVSYFFHQLHPETSDTLKCIFEISVRHVAGCLFYDSDGPTVYRLKTVEGQEEQIDFTDWYRNLENNFKVQQQTTTTTVEVKDRKRKRPSEVPDISAKGSKYNKSQ